MPCVQMTYKDKLNRTESPIPSLDTASSFIVSKSTIISLQTLAFLPELADNSLEVRVILVL